MKNVGVIRQLDRLGRVVIPKSIRKELNWIYDETNIEVSIYGNEVVLRKHEINCYLCGDKENLNNILDHKICSSCLRGLKKYLSNMDIDL